MKKRLKIAAVTRGWFGVAGKSGKKGSSTIFLVMILSSMVLLATAYVQATIRVSGESVGQSVALSAARSLMSEFDKNLKNEYGIFAFRGERSSLEKKMDEYQEPFYSDNPYYSLGATWVEVDDYRLSNPEVLQDAIVEYMLYAAAQDLVDILLDEEGSAGDDNISLPQYPEGRVLRNRQVIESLPSHVYGEGPNLLDSVKAGLSDWTNVFKNSSKNFMVNQYIMHNFKNAQQDLPGKDTFFNYEAEYILKGEYEDERNKNLYRRDLLLVRNIANIATIYETPQLLQQVLTAASVITPGPVSFGTVLLIAEAWSLAEAENDVRLLEHGKKVPFQKKLLTWALDLQSAAGGVRDGYIDTKSKSGLNYEGYLQIFLFFENKNIKLSRVMDLMQINIQGNYDRTFLIKEHQVGLIYETNINYFKIHGESEY
jgi:hypothetical protein